LSFSLAAAGVWGKPHIISILQDDMGYYDSGIHNPEAQAWTGNITSLARSGVVLLKHYTHWHCSPTRRSFLTGRLPIHHGEQLSANNGDDIDLRMTWVSQKLKQQGYRTHWFGKMHTGFRSFNHLGVNKGFDTNIGSLQTGGSYSGPKHSTRWQDKHPIWKDSQFTDKPASCAASNQVTTRASNCTDEYSTDLWGQLAVQAVQEHDSKDPLYLHLCFQAVHVPYDKAPDDPTGNVYRGMLWRADVYIGQLVQALKDKGMWDNTLIVYTADNGGVESGNNYPLRGEKHSNWDGGMRTAAFVSGGLIPAAIRGTNSSVVMHIVDWYPTFSHLAGADPTDDPPVPPQAIDPANPHKNIYGDRSFPPVDGVNVWSVITDPEKNLAPDSAHKNLVLSKEVLISGKYKLLVSQPHFKTQNNGWKQKDGTWLPSQDDQWPCNFQDVSPAASALPVPHPGKTPCLFDLVSDPSEHHNIAAANPGIVSKMWATLNASILAQRDCNGWTYRPIPGPSGSCSPPELLGICNKKCAHAKWKAYGSSDGPICGVPGCSKQSYDDVSEEALVV